MILETTIAGMIVFTGVIMALVLILNFAGNKLLPQGEVDILINEDNDSKLKTNIGYVMHQADSMAARIEFEMWRNNTPTKTAPIKKQYPKAKQSVIQKAKYEKLSLIHI